MADMWKTVGKALKNIGSTGAKGDYIGAAVKGAAIGAGIGGAQSFASGGSFMEGAKSGAFSGATIGMGARAFKVGAMGNEWSKNRGWAGFQKAGGMYKSGNLATQARGSSNPIVTAATNTRKGTKLYKKPTAIATPFPKTTALNTSRSKIGQALQLNGANSTVASNVTQGLSEKNSKAWNKIFNKKR